MKRAMDAARGTAQAALLGLVAVLQAVVPAQADDPLPEFYGLYGVDNGRLVELSASSNSPVLGSDVTFLYFGKSISTSADAIRLTRAYFIRNWVFPGSSFEPNNKWTVIQGSPAVVLRTRPVPGQPEMIYLVPREPLSSGAMYSVRLQNGDGSSFFVDSVPSADQIAQRDYCVDVSVGNPFHIAGGMYTLKNASTCAQVDCVLAGRPASSCAQQSSGEAPNSGGGGASAGSPRLPYEGRWVGQIKWGLLASSAAAITLTASAAGEATGTTQYTKDLESSPYCEGTLIAAESADGQYVFQEKIVRTRG